MNTPAPLLAIQHLAIDGPSGRLLHPLSLTLDHGRTLALIGESGSGKSITALALMGLLPPQLKPSPNTRIEFKGAALPIGDEAEMRALRGRRIALVFQDPMACLNPFLAVGRQIEEVLTRCGERGRTRRHTRRDRLLAEVELDPTLAGRFAHELSGGQQQRVMVAMALAGEPDLLIADEPTSALDASVQAEIIRLLRKLQARHGMAMLFITHDLGVASALAHDVAVLKDGQLVEQGPTSRVLGAPRQSYAQRLVGARGAIANAPISIAPRSKPEQPSLAVHELTVDYPGRGLSGRRVRAVTEVSFDIDPGCTLGLIGESGSGKSTLAAAVAGLRRPTSGDIHVLGTSLAAQRWRFPAELRRQCQIVFQNPAGALNPRLTVEASLAEPLSLAGSPKRERSDRIAAALEEVGLVLDHRHRYPHQLSGGQRQRVCLARALLSDPALLVCDEAVSALDVSVQVEVLGLLRALQLRRGFAMLFIGHDIEVVGSISHRVAVMHDGHIVEAGPTHQVFGEPQHDYTRRLLAARLFDGASSAVPEPRGSGVARSDDNASGRKSRYFPGTAWSVGPGCRSGGYAS